MPAKTLPSATGGLLRSGDHAKLKDSTFLRQRNQLAHEDRDELAALLNKRPYKELKKSWSRRFLFVTGKDIDEAVKSGLVG
ncbi:hypothetical protein TWF696_008324 [Orbilia brochopaga]|uniref:Uncharacterized protein n=1 Tax=Orbilia brochopaga TaxID=3140254 RepID=A0AAV9UL12_9PEZI